MSAYVSEGKEKECNKQTCVCRRGNGIIVT